MAPALLRLCLLAVFVIASAKDLKVRSTVVQTAGAIGVSASEQCRGIALLPDFAITTQTWSNGLDSVTFNSCLQVSTNTVLLPTVHGERSATFLVRVIPAACVSWSASAANVIVRPVVRDASLRCSRGLADSALLISNSTTAQGRESAVVVAEEQVSPFRSVSVDVYTTNIQRIELATRIDQVYRGSSDPVALVAWDAADNMFTSLEGLSFEWSVQQRTFCIDTACASRAVGEAVPSSDAAAAMVLPVSKLADSPGVSVPPVRKAVETGAATADYAGLKVPILVSAESRVQHGYADSVVITGGSQSGRVVLCAQLPPLSAGSDAPVVAACKRIVVSERLKTAPAGSLYLAPATRLKMKLLRTEPGSEAETEAQSSGNYTWVASSSKAAAFAALHGGILNSAESIGSGTLSILDMNLQSHSAEDLASTCDSDGSGAADADRSACSDDSGGLLLPFHVATPSRIALWLEPTDKVPAHKLALAGLEQHFSPWDDLRVAHSASLQLDQADADYQSDDGITRISPWVQGVRGVADAVSATRADGPAATAGSQIVTCSGYSTRTCTVSSASSVHAVAGKRYTVHAHVVDADGHRLLAGENVRVSVRMDGDGASLLPWMSAEKGCDAKTASEPLFVAPVYSLVGCGGNSAATPPNVTASYDASKRRWSATSSTNGRDAAASASRTTIEGRLGPIHRPDGAASWYPGGLRDGLLLARAPIVADAAVALAWPKPASHYALQKLDASGHPSASDSDAVVIQHLLVAHDSVGNTAATFPLVATGGSGGYDYSVQSDVVIRNPTLCRGRACETSMRVDANGIVSVSSPGDAAIAITSKSDQYNGMLLLASSTPISKLQFSMSRLQMNVGSEGVVFVGASDANGRTIDICRHLQDALLWSSDSGNVAVSPPSASDASGVPDNACGLARIRVSSPGVATLSVRYGDVSARVFVHVYTPLSILYPALSSAGSGAENMVSIGHGSSLLMLLHGGPQGFATSDARHSSNAAMVQSAGSGIQLKYCVATAGAPASCTSGRHVAEWSSMQLSSSPAAVTSLDGISLSLEQILPVHSSGAEASSLVYALRATCGIKADSAANSASYLVSMDLNGHVAGDSGAAGAASATLAVRCVAPAAMHSVVRRGIAFTFNDTTPSDSTSGSLASVVATNEEVMLDAWFTTSDGLPVVNATGYLRTKQVTVAVDASPHTQEVAVPATIHFVSTAIVPAFTASDIIQLQSPHLSIPNIKRMFDGAERSDDNVNSERFWSAKSLAGHVLLPATVGEGVGSRSLSVSIPPAASAAADDGLASHSTVVVVTRSVILPTSAAVFAHPSAVQQVRSVGGTGAHEFHVGGKAASSMLAAANSSDAGVGVIVPVSINAATARSAALSTLRPLPSTISAMGVAPSMLYVGPVQVACVDLLLPGAKPTASSLTVGYAQRVTLAINRFIPIASTAPVAISVMDKDGMPFLSAFFPHMSLRFVVSSASGSLVTSEVAGRNGTLLATQAIEITEETQSITCKDEAGTPEHALASGVCKELDFRMRAVGIGAATVKAIVTNCKSADAYAELAASSPSLLPPSDCWQVESEALSVEVVEPLVATPSSLVLVPDAMVRLSVAGGPAVAGNSRDWKLLFQSADEAIAGVESNGMVSAMGFGQTLIVVQLVDTDPRSGIVYGQVTIQVLVALPSALTISPASAAVWGSAALPYSVAVAGSRVRLVLSTPEGHTSLSFAGPNVNASVIWDVPASGPHGAVAAAPEWSPHAYHNAVGLDEAASRVGSLDIPFSTWVTAYGALVTHVHSSVAATLTINARGASATASSVVVAGHHTIAVVPKLQLLYPPVSYSNSITLPPFAAVQVGIATQHLLGFSFSIIGSSAITVTSSGLLQTLDCSGADEPTATLLVQQEGDSTNGYPSQRLVTTVRCAQIAQLAVVTTVDAPTWTFGSATGLDVAVDGVKNARIIALDADGQPFSVGLRSLCFNAAGARCASPTDLGLTVYSSDESVTSASLSFKLGAWTVQGYPAASDEAMRESESQAAARAPRSSSEDDVILSVQGRRDGSAAIHVFVDRAAATIGVAGAIAGGPVTGDYARVDVKSVLQPSGQVSVIAGATIGFSVTSVHARHAHLASVGKIQSTSKYHFAWSSSNTSVVEIDSRSGEAIAISEGSVSIKCWLDVNANGADDDGPDADYGSTTVHVYGGDKVTLSLVPVRLNDLARGGSSASNSAATGSFLLSDVSPTSGAGLSIITAISNLRASSSTARSSAEPVVFALQANAPSGSSTPTVKDSIAVRQNIRFNCSASAFGSRSSVDTGKSWFIAVAFGPGASQDGLEWRPALNATAHEALSSWIKEIDSQRRSLSQSSTVVQQVVNSLAAQVSTERLCVLIPISAPVLPSTLAHLPFSTQPLPAPFPTTVSIGAQASVLRPDRRLRLHRTVSLESGLTTTDAGATFRALHALVSPITASFVTGARLVPAVSVARHLDNGGCGVTWSTLSDATDGSVNPLDVGVRAYRPTIAMESSEGSTGRYSGISASWASSLVNQASNAVVLSPAPARSAFTGLLYGDLSAPLNSHSGVDGREGLESLTSSWDDRLEITLLPVPIDPTTGKLVIGHLNAEYSPEMRRLLIAACTCGTTKADATKSASACPAAIMTVTVNNAALSAAASQLSRPITERKPLSFSGAAVVVELPTTGQSLKVNFDFDDGWSALPLLNRDRQQQKQQENAGSAPASAETASATVPEVVVEFDATQKLMFTGMVAVVTMVVLTVRGLLTTTSPAAPAASVPAGAPSAHQQQHGAVRPGFGLSNAAGGTPGRGLATGAAAAPAWQSTGPLPINRYGG